MPTRTEPRSSDPRDDSDPYRPSFDPKKRLLPRGAIFDGKLAVAEVDGKEVKEYVDHSWYTAECGNRSPMEGKTEPKFTKMGDTKYTWLKAPRIKDRPMEVGALSRVLVANVSGNAKVTSMVDGYYYRKAGEVK